ncbi:MAG: hypothetical protein J6Z22_07205 [Lachnospiraceae bacterium]|nr:hypothetical protein [Lachnospiraceae bacterium]
MEENNQGTNPYGNNPFGDNPFGAGFRADNSFGNAPSENTYGENTSDGNTYGGNASDGNTYGGSASDGNTSGDNASGATPLHPFGDNPFGDPSIRPGNTFGDFGTRPLSEMGEGINFDDHDHEEKVCPHCGTAMDGKETYCMICGMTVDPVFKKDYEKSKEENANGYYGGGSSSGSGSGGYGGGSGSGTGGYGGGSGYNSSPSRPTSYGKSSSNTTGIIAIVAIMAVALIMAVIFFTKGMEAKNAEQVVVLNRKVYSDITFDRDETFTLYGKGDKLYKVVARLAYDVKGVDERSVMMAKNKLLQYGAEQFPDQNFITTEVLQEDDQLILMIYYEYLNVMDNMTYLLENKALTFKNNKTEVELRDYISLKDTMNELKAEKFSVVQQ